ncbi:MAG: Phenylalanine--tRNA ligase beta subunit [Candidatus Thorarchaeota archaeon AB_25]|nr:MAG: Phenylalanine--tRNA ligase beta subunit [Candidatus Thorarchaeota archaeon AB_25]
MIVECRIDDLLSLIGKKLTLEQLEDMLFLIKAEVEKIEGNIIEIEVNPDRQDMLSTEGIARAVRSFIGLDSGLKNYTVKKSGKQIIVKPGLSKIRPFICCSIIKGIPADDELIKEYMHLQDALTSTHGRNRSKASIGLYVYDDLKFPIIYGPQTPEKIKFVPLGFEVEMDGPTILTDHEKGVEFGPIIKRHKKWPLLYDSSNQVLSLPPIINSNSLGRMTTETKNLFVEVTGTHLPTVHQALNIITASLAERGGKIESMTVVYPDGSTDETPDFNPEKMTLKIEDIIALIGLDLTEDEIIQALGRIGYGAKVVKTKQIQVLIPKFRMDILHPVDIMEDIAIGYGFDNLEPAMPQTMTTGKINPVTRIKNKVRDLMVGLGYHEVMSYIMTSPDLLNDKVLRDRPVMTTENPKSRNYSVLRNSLLPILLDFTSQNQHADYPQKIFEVGDVVIPDESKETRVDQVPSICGLETDVKVNITKLMSEIGFLLRNLGLEERFTFESEKNLDYIEGRSASIIVDGNKWGTFGEVSPKILSNFGIGYPLVAFEIFIPRNMDWLK